MKVLKLMPVLGIALLSWIVWKIGIHNILNALMSVNLLYLSLVLILFLPMIFLQTYKWNYLLKRQKINLRFMHLAKLQIISTFYELVTPARIGSFIKIAYLQEKTHNLGKSASSVVIDRALDFLVVALLAFIGSLSLVSRKFNIFYICIAIFFLFLAGFATLLNKKAMNFFAKILYIILVKDKFKNKAKESFHEFYRNMPSLKSIFIVFSITVLFWILVYTQAYASALAFGVKIPYLRFLTIFPISVIISLIPVTVSGLGTREAVLLGLLEGYAGKNQIVAFSLVWAVIGLIVNAALGLFFIYQMNRKSLGQKKNLGRRGK